MNALHVKFPDVWPGWEIKDCILASALDTGSDTNSSESNDSSASETAVVTVDPKALTDYWSDSPVFRGNFHKSQCPWERVNVALKFAMRGDLIGNLIEEAEMYLGPLESLQGSTVPRFYGLYIGSHDDREIACLVLEFCGDVLQKPFRQLSVDIRIRILEGLGEIHRQGFLHGDFAERNILQRNGDIRIIDFDQAIGGHNCRCDMNFRSGQTTPDQRAFGCEHLWRISRHVMKIWG